MLFNPVHDSRVRESARAAEYEALDLRFARAFEKRRAAARALANGTAAGDGVRAAEERARFRAADAEVLEVRRDAVTLVKEVSGDQAYNDVNYVFPTFVTSHLPIGLVGLIIAAIFAAAMSSIAAELNSLSTATLIDFYRRWAVTEATDRHYLVVSRLATAIWGALACVVAVYATNLGSLIEVVNRFGSFFYGSLLGVFVLAIGTRRATGHGAFVGLICGMAAVAFVAFRYPAISFLWHNVVGVVVVVVIGMAISLAAGGRIPPAPPAGGPRPS